MDSTAFRKYTFTNGSNISKVVVFFRTDQIDHVLFERHYFSPSMNVKTYRRANIDANHPQLNVKRGYSKYFSKVGVNRTTIDDSEMWNSIV